MRRVACLILTLILASGASGKDPVAQLKGPSTAPVDSEFFLKFAGSSGDDPIELELASGPEPVEPAILYNANQEPIYGLVAASQPGAYRFVVIATGKPDGAKKARRAYAFWTVQVGQLPGPSPEPSPGPQPGPGPFPDPSPLPVGEAIYVTLILDIDSSNPGTAVLRTSPRIREAADQLGMIWRSYDDDAQVVQERNFMSYVTKAGGVPALIVQSASGTVLASQRCPNGEAEVIAFMRKFRSN